MVSSTTHAALPTEAKMENPSVVDLKPLLEQAFYVAPAWKGTRALVEATQTYVATHGPDRFNYELVAPEKPDANWLDTVARRLIYHCDSLDVPLPQCAGVFVSIFKGDQLYCLTAKTFLEQAARVLGVDLADLARTSGTQEAREAQR
ncbi:MAG: STAUR_1299 family protein [Myxococcota bacterium]